MSKTRKNPDTHVSLKEVLLWNSSPMSVAITFLVLMHASFYCTNVLKMPTILVGTLFAVSKILDSITDLIAGFIIDRTQTRWGKGRPYEIFMVFLWLSTWLLFSCPENFSLVAKSVWVFCMYTFMNAVCTTFLGGNNVVYMVRAFKTKEQQAKVTAFGSFITMAASMAFNIWFPSAMADVAMSHDGWSRLIGMLAIPLTAIGALRMLTIKEQFNADAKTSAEKAHLREVLKLIKVNPHAVSLFVASFLVALVTGMGVADYYWHYIIGDLSLQGVAAAGTVLGVPLAFIMPAMRRKMGMKGMCVAGMIFSAAGYLLMFFAGANMMLVIIATIISTVGLVPWNMMFNMFVVDLADFNQIKGISRMEATMGATFGFARKAGGAIGGFVLGVLLHLGGFVSGSEVQSAAALMTIRISAGIVPLLALIIVCVLMRTYTLDHELPKLQAEMEVNQ